MEYTYNPNEGPVEFTSQFLSLSVRARNTIFNLWDEWDGKPQPAWWWQRNRNTGKKTIKELCEIGIAILQESPLQKIQKLALENKILRKNLGDLGYYFCQDYIEIADNEIREILIKYNGSNYEELSRSIESRA